MAKKQRDKGGRPPMPADEKLSEIIGYRFTPSDADEIRTATKYDDALIQRIRDSILRETRFENPEDVCIDALSALSHDGQQRVAKWLNRQLGKLKTSKKPKATKR